MPLTQFKMPSLVNFSLYLLFLFWTVGLNAAPTSHRHLARHGHRLTHRHDEFHAHAPKPHVLFEPSNKHSKRSLSPSTGGTTARIRTISDSIRSRGSIDDTAVLW
ncbi:hypothetical protein BGZ63DRAFT_369364 [Mariannaea sp. PMI_226]|nr:hypothetical protein BGZ63DRAFT_369364 [Mariannaea sp. PMI_226]